jgi:hypothetical protein
VDADAGSAMADPKGAIALIVREHAAATIPILLARRKAGSCLVLVGTLIM